MTKEEKAKMLAEIMEVVDKHVEKSKEKETPKHSNKYGHSFGISDEAMSKWKEEYKKMRVEGRTILEEVRKNPIDTSKLVSSFDIDYHTQLLK